MPAVRAHRLMLCKLVVPSIYQHAITPSSMVDPVPALRSSTVLEGPGATHGRAPSRPALGRRVALPVAPFGFDSDQLICLTALEQRVAPNNGRVEVRHAGLSFEVINIELLLEGSKPVDRACRMRG